MNVMLDFICIGSIELRASEKKENVLLTVGFEPTTLRSFVRLCLNLADRVLLNGSDLKRPIYRSLTRTRLGRVADRVLHI